VKSARRFWLVADCDQVANKTQNNSNANIATLAEAEAYPKFC
jgi:hypothetical protein